MSRKTRLELGGHALLANVICNAPESYNFGGRLEHNMMCLHFTLLSAMCELLNCCGFMSTIYTFATESPVYSWIYLAQ